MPPLLHLLAQIDKLPMDGRPALRGDAGTSGTTWIIAAILVAGTLLITFKTSKRNHLDRD